MLRAGMLGFALGLASLLWARPARPPVIVVSQVAPPVAIEITLTITPAPQPPTPQPPSPPPPPPPSRVDPDLLGPCPTPFMAGTAGDLLPPPDIHSITLSHHDVRLLAMWSHEALHVSVDEGRTFQRVLDHLGEIGDAAFDCRGRLHVIRGDGDLGTYDPRSKTERWTHVATFWSRGDEVDTGRLILDGASVAVVGNTPARRDELRLVRRDEDGRWHAKHLFSNREQGYWSGIDVGSIRTLPGGRVRMMVTPNMADFGSAECGYSKIFEVTFDLGGRGIEVRDHGEGAERRDDRLQQDPAGRWLLLTDGRAERLTTEELVERLAKLPAP